MHLFPSALQALLSLLCLLVASEVAACPLHSHDSDHATSPITAGDHDREVVRRFAASLVSSNGTLTVRNIITPGGGTVCRSSSLASQILQNQSTSDTLRAVLCVSKSQALEPISRASAPDFLSKSQANMFVGSCAIDFCHLPGGRCHHTRRL